MPEQDSAFNTIQIIMGILVTISISLSGFTLSWMFETNANIKVMQNQLNDMALDKDKDIAQDKSVSKHWKIVSFHKDQINTLRIMEGLPLVSWPDLGE